MYQEPSGSRIFGERTHVLATPSSNFNRPNNISQSTFVDLSMRPTHSANYSLPPKPNNFGLHTNGRPIKRYEPMYLTNWRVNVKNIKSEQGGTRLIAALSGTLLAIDRQTILYEVYDAGRLGFVISKNIVRTNKGVYHLLGPIIQGYPNNLYRACLVVEGIPKTWKYVLTQFSGKLPDTYQRLTSTTDNAVTTNNLGKRILELIKSFRVLRNLAIITERRTKELIKARKPIGFERVQFQQKIFRSLRNVNNQIIMGLKELLKKD